jgi:sulfide:quinone oxidoreductase
LRDKIREDEVRITLLEPNTLHYYQPAFLLIPLGLMDDAEAYRPLSTLIPDGVRWIREKAKYIDPENRVVRYDGDEIEYDYLIISTGAQLDYSCIPNLREYSYNFYSYKDVLRLKEAINRFNGGTIVVGVAGVPYRCPPAPIEMILLLEDYYRKLGIRGEIDLKYIFPLPRVFPIEGVSEIISPIFEERGIETHLMFNLEDIDGEKKKLISLEGEEIKYDLAILIPPHKGADVIIESGLGDRGGWIPTDRYTLNMKGYDNVYIVGDASDLPISKAGSVADFEAEIVTKRITEDMEGYEPRHIYDGKVMCFVVTGIGEATTLVFDYENPPRPHQPNFACYWMKLIYNKLYWSLTARSALTGVIL